MDNEIYYTLEECLIKLQKNEISAFYEIPSEYRDQQEIINAARALGLRKLVRCGFDVITSSFFVEEIVTDTDWLRKPIEKKLVSTFGEFQSYFDFLQGDIYDNACYYRYIFTEDIINRFQLDVDRLNMSSELSYTVDDIVIEVPQDEKNEYEKVEQQAALRKRWIKKYNACTTCEELVAVNDRHRYSKDRTNVDFYLWNYIYHHGKDSFEVILQFVCEGHDTYSRFEKALCFLYDPERVLANYDYVAGSASTNKKRNSQFENMVREYENSDIVYRYMNFYDEKTHYYCRQTQIAIDTGSTKNIVAEIYRYFETFAEFSEYLSNDLSYCDLSKNLYLTIDTSLYTTNETTKLPAYNRTDLNKVLSKRYNRVKELFEVVITWIDQKGIKVYERYFPFRYFFDFTAFLKNDLSGADLLFCDGLHNISDFSEFILTNARLRSFVEERVGESSQKYELICTAIDEFSMVKCNEIQTEELLKADRSVLYGNDRSVNARKIFYVTDIHLMHRLQHSKCVTRDDCIYVIQRIIDSLLENLLAESFLLIGGDVASEFGIFRLFVELLRQTIDERRLHTEVVFVLGNHELWEFSGYTVDSIVAEYRQVLSDNKMHLLQNEILYLDRGSKVLSISEQDILVLSDEDIRNKLRTARVILFGGVGFSGYNYDLNADSGVYRATLSREDEIAESRNLEILYNRICSCLSDKEVIIFTHMPFTDWHKDDFRQSGFVYVSGHNHRNYFSDDGVVRIYADNQAGYRTTCPRAKYFFMEYSYDWFSDYEDGIYQITREDYIDFYREKNIPLTFNRPFNRLFMLKKNNYYCFILQKESGLLLILNGGNWKSLSRKDIQWYYDNMEAQIALIKCPLDRYNALQQQISKVVKQVGGSGFIHGAIIDIDFYNHLYVNPHDLSITPYYALSITVKYVYPSVTALLEDKCPRLYENYQNLLSDGNVNALSIRGDNDGLRAEPELYLSTDIYSVSLEIKKMQRLYTYLLTAWYDVDTNINILPEDTASALPEEIEMVDKHIGE